MDAMTFRRRLLMGALSDSDIIGHVDRLRGLITAHSEEAAEGWRRYAKSKERECGCGVSSGSDIPGWEKIEEGPIALNVCTTGWRCPGCSQAKMQTTLSKD